MNNIKMSGCVFKNSSVSFLSDHDMRVTCTSCGHTEIIKGKTSVCGKIECPKCGSDKVMLTNQGEPQ